MRFQWLMLTGLVGLAVVFLAGEEVVATMRMSELFKEQQGPHQFEVEVSPIEWQEIAIRWLPWLILSPCVALVAFLFVPGRVPWAVALVVQILGAVVTASIVWWVEHQVMEWVMGREIVFMNGGLNEIMETTGREESMALDQTTDSNVSSIPGLDGDSPEIVVFGDPFWWYWVSYVWRAMILCVVGVVPALAMLSSERERLRDQLARELAETENQLLRAQLQPHFLFNALNGIQVLIDEDPERAKVVLRRLSALLRNTLEDVNKTLLPLDRELEILDDYLELERLRFGHRIDIAVDVEPGNDEVLVPAFCLQPLVENSLIHGPGKQPDGGRVELVVARRRQNLEMLVRDDGPGASPADVTEGHGLGILQSRLERQFGGRGGLTVRTKPGEGFAVAVEVPVAGGQV